MAGALPFGYGLIAVSAVLLAVHWRQWRDWRALPRGRRREHLRAQLQRRWVASALIGVVGAGMTLAEHVPRTPQAMTAYGLALLTGGVVILLIALADLRAMRRWRDEEQLEPLAAELRKIAPKGP